ncbi:MAG: efflux RND transporter periplasmic adaptor subunit [Vicinamibacterales bacterium]
MKILKAVAASIVLAAVFFGGYVTRAARQPDRSAAIAERRVLYYVDPMHPSYTSDKPGVAPDCGMPLEPVYAGDADAPTPAGARTVLFYRDPRQPTYTANTPGVNPETGNALEPVFAVDTTSLPSGVVRISPERQQMIGVRFVNVERGGNTRTIRTVGKVVADETRVGHVHTRIEGWLEQVFVDFTGALVKAGEPLLTIYSPEMLASQQELLLAARARDLMLQNPLASAAQQGDSLFAAARRRLQLWDLGDDQIDQVLRTGQPIRNVTVPAPMSGVVTERNAFPNQRVTPDSDLYTITDLSHVWIMADVFESDIADIRAGDAAFVTFANSAAPPISARVNYIQPQIDPTTRTLQVRLDAVNPSLRMKPEMFVNVEFRASAADRLTIPSDAVLDTGDRQTVFVDRGDGYLEPRPVTLGERFGDRVAVTSGLESGERIVASGTFLIDSESQLKAAARGLGAPTLPASTMPAAQPPSHEGHGHD